MYKVLLIDDEEKNLLLLRKIIKWEDFRFQVCAQATDGAEGLQVWRELQPDLVVVDIRMPVMDGLEFMERLRRMDQEVPILILTAYNDFEYARSAITWGVSDYLLKPIDRKKLAAALEKVRDRLDSREKSDEDYRKMQGALAKKKTEDLLSEAATLENSQNPSRELEQLFADGDFFAAMLVDALPEKPGQPFYYEESGYQFRRAGKRYFLLDAGRRGSLTDAFTAYLRVGKGNQCFLLTSGEIRSYGDFTHWIQLLNQWEYLGFYETGSRIFPLDKPFSEFSEGAPGKADSAILEEFIRHGGAAELTGYLDQCFADFADRRVQPDAVREFCLNLLASLKIRMTEEYSDRMSLVLRHIQMERLYFYHTAEELKRFIAFQLRNAAAQLSELLEQGRMNPTVEKALEYTRRSCFDPSFSASDAACAVNLSKNYFVKLFRDESGQNFWDYVTDLRINKAKELLRDTTLAVGEISGRVGYESPYHFSRKFKSIVGVTPNEFRNS